jgi:hypothetical protein
MYLYNPDQLLIFDGCTRSYTQAGGDNSNAPPGFLQISDDLQYGRPEVDGRGVQDWFKG